MARKILIVDDDQKTRLLLKTYLEKNQFEVLLGLPPGLTAGQQQALQKFVNQLVEKGFLREQSVC